MRELAFEDVKYILSKVGDISLFHYLHVDEKWDLLSLCDIFEYSPGEKIISQGETGTSFYAILSGSVNVTINEKNNDKDIFLNTIGAGDFFGESGIFSNLKRTANVIAANTTEILCIPRNSIFTFINMNPQAGVKVLMIFIDGLMKKLTETNKELAIGRREVMDQSAIDQFLHEMEDTEKESERQGHSSDGIKPQPMHGLHQLVDSKSSEGLFYHPCSHCKGTGVVKNNSCMTCLGRGIIPTDLALQFLDFMNVWNLAHFKKSTIKAKNPKS